MSNITINTKNATIELTKAFAKNASRYGSPAYIEVQNARKDYPNYRVVTVAQKTAKPKYKGLTFEYMEKYIAQHDNEGKNIMAQFLDLRGESKEAKENVAASAGYSEIKTWFFEQYPEIEKFHKDRKDLLKKIAAQRAEKQAAMAAA